MGLSLSGCYHRVVSFSGCYRILAAATRACVLVCVSMICAPAGPRVCASRVRVCARASSRL